MKFVIVVSLLVVFTGAEFYNSDYDDLDLDAIARDPEKLKMFLDCFNDKGPCDTIMMNLKQDIPDAIIRSCDKCTQAQKHMFKRFLVAIKVKLPEGYLLFKQKYDPEDKYFGALELAIANA